MAAQPLRPAAARLLLDGLEHAAEIARVVTRARHDLRAQQVRLLLVFAAVLEHRRAETELAPLGDDLAPPAADHGAGNRSGELPELEVLGLGRVRGAVAQEDMAQLVRHHADDFSFARRRFEHAAVDEHRPAGQCERVDLFEVHRRERVPRRWGCSVRLGRPRRVASRADRDSPQAPNPLRRDTVSGPPPPPPARTARPVRACTCSWER